MFGDPTILVIANPDVNDEDNSGVPEPGTVVRDIDVDDDTGLFGTTDVAGIALLSPVPPGSRTITFSNGVAGDVTTTMGTQELREIAVAVDDTGAAIMTEVEYDFGGTVVELTPDTPTGEIEAALAASDSIIVFRAGTYVIGDLALTGSQVTLFGEGILDRTVVIDGNVTVSGSNNRIRGAVITGQLTIGGSNAGVAFSTVLGPTVVTGSAARLLYNEMCGSTAASGSGLTAVGNGGMAPIAASCP